MDMVSRYIAAIRRNLPARRADDIAAELGDILAAKIEDKEAALGRPLTPGETDALIRDFGHPWVVAARYRDRQYLIGPDVYPFYLAVLRIALLVVAAAELIGAASHLLAGDRSVAELAWPTLGGLFASLLINAGIVTMIFAVLERTGFPAEHLQRWTPAQLPLPQDRQPSQWGSAIEVALSIAVLIWWAGGFGLPVAGGSGLAIHMAPVFGELYWPILALIAARLVHNLIQWLRPRWTGLRLLTGGATAIGGLVVLAIIYQAGQWAVVTATGAHPSAGDAAAIQTSLNLALRLAIIVIAIIWTIQLGQGLWGCYRRRVGGAPN